MQMILVPTDGSEPADKAIELACDLASRHRARICLLHVLLRDKEPEDLRRLAVVKELDAEMQDALARAEAAPPDPSVPAAVFAMDPGAVQHPVPVEVLQTLGRKVLEAAERAVRAKDVDRVTQVLEDGEAAQCIVDAAARERADTIVMGHRGLGDIEGITLGSVSNRVSHLAACTVIMIR
jgi:nucleotide-binding universal stress UspA family protein